MQYEHAYEEARLKAEAQQEKLDKLVKAYELEGTVLVAEHEDALQFKYLAGDLAKEARRQRQNVEEVMEDEMKQFSFQVFPTPATPTVHH